MSSVPLPLSPAMSFVEETYQVIALYAQNELWLVEPGNAAEFAWMDDGALLALGAVREVLGFGSLFGFHLFPASYPSFLLFVLPPGAFIALGLMLAVMNRRQARVGA